VAHAARRSRDNFRIPALTDPPSSLNWISATLEHDPDVVGEFGLKLASAIGLTERRAGIKKARRESL